MNGVPSSPTLSASDLYATSCGGRNGGDHECHWCASKCSSLWRHDDQHPGPFEYVRARSTFARRPTSPYVCFGCWRFRWKRTTLPFLGGGFKDGQCAADWSLWFTEQGAWAVRLDEPADQKALYEQLLKPPLRFGLMLLVQEPGAVVKQSNRLHLAVANDHVQGIQASTPLEFTVNSILHTYTPYDLEEGLRTEPQGKSPGVQALIRLLGEHTLPPRVGGRPEKLPVGRPPPLEDGRKLQKHVVGKSGG